MKNYYSLETLLTIGTTLLHYNECTIWKEKGKGYIVEVHYALTAQKNEREYVETLYAKDFFKDESQRDAIAKRLDTVQKEILNPFINN